MAWQIVAGQAVQAIFGTAVSGLLGAGGDPLSPRFRRFFQDVKAAGIAPTPGINPTAPAPGLPTGGDIFEDLLKRPGNVGKGPTPDSFEDLIRRPRSRPPSDFEDLLKRKPYRAAPGSLTAALARASVLIGGLLWPSTLGDSDLGYKAPKTKTGRKGPPRRPKLRTRSRPKDRALPYPPELQTVADRLPPPNEPYFETRRRPQIAIPSPRPDTRAAALPRPRPVRAPTAAPAGRTYPSPEFLAFPFFAPANRPARLPTPQAFTPSPLTASGPANRIPEIDRRGLTAPNPAALTFPATQPLPSDPCQCPKGTRTSRKRKPRTVCYRGEYVEKASGLTKFRKRKIPCQ
jgi:hypothetical protein